MKAFLYVTDTHATGRGPRSRLDSYWDAMMEKFYELRKVIQEKNVEAVFHGGDLFDKPIISLSLLGELATYIRSTNVPWYVVPGNHDLFGYDLSSLPQTSLGLLAKAGVIHILDRSKDPVMYSLGHCTVSFEGQPYHKDIDQREVSLDYYTISDASYRILIPHSMLLNKNYFPDVPYTHIGSLKDKTHVDAILVGHYHDGYGKQVITHTDGKQTIVINPGSMMRDEASKSNMTRIPSYILIYAHEDGRVEFDIRPFQCAKKGKEIFDRSHIEEASERNKQLSSFEKTIQVDLPSSNIHETLRHIIQTSNIPKEIEEKAIDVLTKAQEFSVDISDNKHSLSSYKEKPYRLYIQKLIIKNFQSHKYTEIDFHDGLNAIIGPSHSGKTAIIRALRFVLYNEPKGSNFIRHGENEVMVRVYFSDGAYLERKRTRKSSGSYIIGYPDGQTREIKGFSNQSLVDIWSIHQMPYIQLTKDLETCLNVNTQLEPHFLIGHSPSTRAMIIGHLTGVNHIDYAIKILNQSTTSTQQKIKMFKQEKEELHEELEQFSDIEEKERRLNQIKQCIEAIQEKQNKLDRIKKLVDIQQNIKQLERAIEEAHQPVPINKIKESILNIENQIRLQQRIKKLLSLKQATENEQEALNQYKKPPIDEIRKNITVFQKKITKRHRLSVLQNDILRVNKDIENLTNTGRYINIEKICEHVHKIELLLDRHRTVFDLRDKLRRVEQEEERLLEHQMLVASEKAEVEHLYHHTLETLGYCPMCKQKV